MGIVITDQRMPRQSGVDLLRRIRHSRPGIVRMLTTAYSDLETAIEAVNSGAVFKYVVKPWNLRELRGVLLRGMEFFLVQRERDALLREKLSILERLVVTDRVRSLAILAAALAHHVRNPAAALKAFLDLVQARPCQDLPSTSGQIYAERWKELVSEARQESQSVLRIAQSVVETLVEPPCGFKELLRLDHLVRKGLERLKGDGLEMAGLVQVDIAPDLPPFRVDARMVERLFSILSRSVLGLNAQGADVIVRAKERIAVRDTQGMRILIVGNGPRRAGDHAGSVLATLSPRERAPCGLGLELLPAFFIAHHHGGDILIHRAPGDGTGFELRLPFDPDATERPVLPPDYLEKIMTSSGAWDDMQRNDE